MDTGRGRREKADFTGWGRVDRAQGNGAPQCYPRRTGFNRELLAPPPAKAGGGWEGVPTVRADPENTPPQPSPDFAGGRKTVVEGRSVIVRVDLGGWSIMKKKQPK